jgi:hypothetical protein
VVGQSVGRLELLQFFESLRVGSADEVGVHVENPPLGVHQVLLLLPLDLDQPHHNAVNHVHGLSLAFRLHAAGVHLLLRVKLKVLLVCRHFGLADHHRLRLH